MKLIFLLVLTFIFSAEAHGIITRHDIPDSRFIVSNSDFPALVPLFGPNDCIATLVQANFLITVAHCAEELVVGSNLFVSNQKLQIEEVILHPDWNDKLNVHDIALIKLKKNVVGVTPLPLYQKRDEVGQIITLVGRGVSGTGLVGENGAIEDSRLRRVTNRITGADSMYFEIVFDPPGSAETTPLEGVGASGDSGGPSFLRKNGKDYIVGLNSWGSGENTGVGIGEYTAKDYQTRVSSYIPWLKSQGLRID